MFSYLFSDSSLQFLKLAQTNGLQVKPRILSLEWLTLGRDRVETSKFKILFRPIEFNHILYIYPDFVSNFANCKSLLNKYGLFLNLYNFHFKLILQLLDRRPPATQIHS